MLDRTIHVIYANCRKDLSAAVDVYGEWVDAAGESQHQKKTCTVLIDQQNPLRMEIVTLNLGIWVHQNRADRGD